LQLYVIYTHVYMYKKLSCVRNAHAVSGYVVSKVTVFQSASTVVASHAVLESFMSGFKAKASRY